MRGLAHVLFLIYFLLMPLEARPLVFAPLPYSHKEDLFEDFSPMIRYLEQTLHTSITFRYESKYDYLIEAFVQNKIDIAYLGPLPLRILMEKFPDALPLVSFNEKNGKQNYRCVLVKFPEDTIDTSKPKTITVALTQPLSTCGYFMSDVLLNSSLHLPLKKVQYRYVNNHDEVALSVIRGDYLLGGMKESLAQEYYSLGLRIFAYSDFVPGFALVINAQTVSPEQIIAIKQALLSAPSSVYSTWGSSISHGMSDARKEDYLRLDIKKLNEIPQEGNF